MQVKNILPSYRASIAVVAAIVVLVVVVVLFTSNEKQRKNNKEAVKENIEDVKDIAPITISEETKRLVSERLPGDAIVITEETKRLLSERPQGSIPITITPETAKSLSTR